MRRRGILAVFLAATALLLPRVAHAQALIADLSSHLVAITTGFTGTEVLLFGAVEGEGDVIVVVRGPDERVIVRHKERIDGIYVNRKQMTFSRVPSYYMVAASRDLSKIASPGELARQEIGVNSLRFVPEVERDPAVVAQFRTALIRNKQAEGLFGNGATRITFLGARLFRVNVYFPSNVPVGTYQVQVFLFRDGTIVSAQTTPLVISKIGASADIFDFAHRYTAAYGAIAVLIALMAGWLASVIFRRA